MSRRQHEDETPPVTPWTKPDLVLLPPDDPAVVALTSPLPELEALPPAPGEDSGPWTRWSPGEANDLLEHAERQRRQGGARSPLENRIDHLEQQLLELRIEVQNLTTWARLISRST